MDDQLKQETTEDYAKLVVVQQDAAIAQLFAKNLVLHLKILDNTLLLTIELGSQEQDNQVPRLEYEFQHENGHSFPQERRYDARTSKPSQSAQPPTHTLNTTQLARILYDLDRVLLPYGNVL